MKLIKKVEYSNDKEIYYSLIANDECIGTTHNVFNKEMKDDNEDVFFNKLSLKNCQAIERGYDLDKLVKGFIERTGYNDFDSYSYKLGFQKALELVEHRLSKETEWQVEIVMDICGDKVYAVPEPALDEQGCLILKRIDN